MSTIAECSDRQRLASKAYLWACEEELRAFKPGNVSLHSEGHDMTVEDFRKSAVVSAPALCNPAFSLGEKIFNAIHATRSAVGCNTNLGIVLLAAPLIHAFLAIESTAGFHGAVINVLDNTTVQDADWVYRAIRLAAPAGLGAVADQDVAGVPDVNLLEAMRLAAGRDSVARQYTDSFDDVFHQAVPLYHSRLSLWDDAEWATVAVFAWFLARYPDSHVGRKSGLQCAGEVSDRVADLDAALASTRSPQKYLGVLRELDTDFKSRGVNPGTSADLTVATLLVAALGS